METGPTEFRSIIPADLVLPVGSAYNTALQASFSMAVVIPAASIIGVVFKEWKSVHKKKVEEAVKEIEIPTRRNESPMALPKEA
jgi:hypothetical protein